MTSFQIFGRERQNNTFLSLVVEQSGRLLNEDHIQFVARVEHSSIILTSCRCRDIFHTRSCSAINVIDEWELAAVSMSCGKCKSDLRKRHLTLPLHRASRARLLSPLLRMAVAPLQSCARNPRPQTAISAVLDQSRACRWHCSFLVSWYPSSI